MALLSVIDFPDEPAAYPIESQPEFVAADTTDTFPNDGKTGLYVKNSSGAAMTVTVVAARQCSHGFLHNAAISVPDGFAGFVATEFENDRFSDDQGVVTVAYSDATSIEVAAVRLRN